MKKILFSVWFIFSCSLLQAQSQKINLNNLQDLPANESCYTFALSDSMTVSFCKLDENTQLSASGPHNFWIGKTAYGVKQSNIAIIFSKPVTSLHLIISHFNFDNNGGEFLNGFTIYDEAGAKIATPSINWESGNAVNDSSSLFSTVFNKKKQTIRATSGGWGPETTGRLSISSSTPFTRFTMHQEVVYGNPNGLLVSDEINFTPAPVVIKEKIKTDSIKVQEIIPPVALITKTDSTLLLKEATPLAKTDTVKQEPLKVPVKKIPAKKTVIKKTEPKKESVKRTTPKEKTVRTIPPIKTTVKKAPGKKKVITPAVVKKEVKIEKTHELSQARLVEVGEKIKLEKVYFKQSLPELLPDSYPELDTLVNILKEQPTLEIEIQGHTDDQGVPALNMQLSEKRVEAVKAYLVSKGIAAQRLTGEGFGGSRPCIDNQTEEHRKQNRRVEFMITKR